MPAFAGFFASPSAIIFLISSIAPATLTADISLSPSDSCRAIMLNVFTDSPITSVPSTRPSSPRPPSAVVGPARPALVMDLHGTQRSVIWARACSNYVRVGGVWECGGCVARRRVYVEAAARSAIEDHRSTGSRLAGASAKSGREGSFFCRRRRRAIPRCHDYHLHLRPGARARARHPRRRCHHAAAGPPRARFWAGGLVALTPAGLGLRHNPGVANRVVGARWRTSAWSPYPQLVLNGAALVVDPRSTTPAQMVGFVLQLFNCFLLWDPASAPSTRRRTAPRQRVKVKRRLRAASGGAHRGAARPDLHLRPRRFARRQGGARRLRAALPVGVGLAAGAPARLAQPALSSGRSAASDDATLLDVGVRRRDHADEVRAAGGAHRAAALDQK